MSDTEATSGGCAATPPEELRKKFMSYLIPKSEREWWAVNEIERLQRELAQAKEDMAQWKFRFEECESDWEKAIKDLTQIKEQ